MKTEYRYTLDKTSKKHHCPNCGKKRFVRFIDTTTGEYLPEQYGRCDREANCPQQEYNNPYKDGYAKAIWEQEQGIRSDLPNNWKPQPKKLTPHPQPETIYFDFETFKQTLNNYESNYFIQNLCTSVAYPFPVDVITKVIQQYRLGTVTRGHRAGAVTFPFIDVAGNIRTIQVKQFDEQNHTTGTDFLHSIITKYYAEKGKALPKWLEAYNKQEKRITCLFGEHLLSRYPFNPIALVEAPKTAIYGTLYFGLPESPKDMIWLAVYNKSSFSYDKIQALRGRNVFVFPDLSKDGSTFNEWCMKAKDYENRLAGTRFIFSNLLERIAPKEYRQDGSDLADFLIRMDWRLFRNYNHASIINLLKRIERAELTGDTQLGRQCIKDAELLNFDFIPTAMLRQYAPTFLTTLN